MHQTRASGVTSRVTVRYSVGNYVENTIMTGYFFWWIACAILIGAELLTGTFYLAVLALAAAVGAIAAHAGLDWHFQAAAACVVGVLGCVAVNRWREIKGVAHSELDMMDAGQTVRVMEWKPDGRARVSYRGSSWDAELADASQPRAEVMAIVGTKGNLLIIGKPAV
jgi:membrane protein implicated in regulation of membrane protease activity